MTITSLSNKPALLRRFQVRVSQPGVATYRYTAVATGGFELWVATFERLVSGRDPETVSTPDNHPRVSVKRIREI